MQNRGNRQPETLVESRLPSLTEHLDSSVLAGPTARKGRNDGKPSPLAVLVRRRLEELDLKQSDFCRLTGFDQGLLSKIQNSVITSLSLESTLRLALGLSIPPRVIFAVTERSDMQDLVVKAYAVDFFPELSAMSGMKIPAPVLEITGLALCAYSMGRSLAAAQVFMSHLTAARRAPRDRQQSDSLTAEAYRL
jgi:transcriptional regulator with XRE-family HTH domain